MELSERRKGKRFRGQLPVEFEQGRGVTRDFSTDGVYFETELPLCVGDHIEFVIPLTYADMGMSTRVRFRGEVLRVDAAGTGNRGVAVAVHSIHSYGFGSLDKAETEK